MTKREDFSTSNLLKIFCVAIVTALTMLLSAPAYTQPSILLKGMWVQDVNLDPFENKYPTTAYLPAGTILFEIQPAPNENEYVFALTHNGFWVRIEKPAASEQWKRSLSELSIKTPSNTLFMHQSILCLEQTNRIVKPNRLCDADSPTNTKENGSRPVGEGWVFTFSNSKKPGWLTLSADLNSRTKQELNDRGWHKSEARFEIHRKDLTRLEIEGHVTLLNKTYPIVSFKNRNVKPVMIKCGTKTVTAGKLYAALKVEASAEAKTSLFGWLAAKLGINAEAGAKAEKTYTLTIDTTNRSFLYYFIDMYDHVKKRSRVLKIEKEFECKSGPRIDFGKKIFSVYIEIDSYSKRDPIPYTFDNPEHYLAMDEEVFDHLHRPAFLSLNTPDIYRTTVSKVKNRLGIFERRIAEFIVSNINYSCPQETRRKCAELAKSNKTALATGIRLRSSNEISRETNPLGPASGRPGK